MTVTINGTTGYTGPIGAIGDLSTTGNTTLGDASGDTLTINGNTASIPNNLNFTSGNIGVGVTPRAKLDVNGGIILGNGQNLSWGNVYGAGIPLIAGAAASGLDFYPAGSTSGLSMRLDTSGNLGLGVTPSAWNSDYKALDVSTYGNFYGRVATPNVGVVLNGYRNSGGSWIYKTTNAAARYEQDSGFHIWYNAASGTAGNAITFTQAMTLDTSGNLGVGTASPSLKLDVVGNSRVAYAASGNVYTTVASGASVVQLYTDGTTSGIYASGAAIPLTFSANGAERMRITSGGTVIVGTGTTSSTDTMLLYPASGDAVLNIKGPGAYMGLNSIAGGYSAITGYDNGTARWSVGQFARGGSDGASIYYGSSYTEAARFASTITTYRALLLSGGMADTYTGSLSGNYTSGTWYEIANSGNLGTGIFILQVYVDTYSANGSVYYMIYASVPFFMYNVGSNNTVTFDLPTMFGTGHASNGVAAPPIRLRLTPSGQGIFVDIQPNQSWTGLNGTGGRNVN